MAVQIIRTGISHAADARRTVSGPSVRDALCAVLATTLLLCPAGCGAQQTSAHGLDERALREYAGVYQWRDDTFVDLQLWAELSGTNHLVAFDESGEIRTLFPTERDHFFAGPAAADSSAVQSRIDFERDSSGRITGLVWRRERDSARVARRVDIERREDVSLPSHDVKLAGPLTPPRSAGRPPAIILVHASGAE